MASHRKPRTPLLSIPGPRAAAGFTTVAFASVALLGETASATPQTPAKPSIESVQTQVDTLYQESALATDRFNAADEKAEKQTTKANQLLDQAAEKTQKLNEARRTLGTFAAAQYRTGGIGDTASLLLSEDPEKFLDQSHMLDRASGQQKRAVEDYRTQQTSATTKRSEAVKSLDELTKTQAKLKTEKKTVQTKLAAARKLLNTLTAEEKTRLDKIKQQKRAAAEAAATTTTTSTQQSANTSGGGSTSTDGGSSVPASGRAAQAIAFAKSQVGKAYQSGFEGPNAYDCSGLTQAAYASAGVSISRTTYTQVNDGQRVSQANLQPGDLVFFYSSNSHVGIYLGNGKMVHAANPSDGVEYGEVSWMPFYAAVRIV